MVIGKRNTSKDDAQSSMVVWKEVAPAPPPPLASGVALIHVVHVDIPKAGGTSVGSALVRAGAAACTHAILGCPCLQPSCVGNATFVQMERPHAAIVQWLERSRAASWRLGSPVWIALVRSPEERFYSAVGYYCSMGLSRHPHSLGCEPNATATTLREHARWFAEASLDHFTLDNFSRVWGGARPSHWVAPNLQARFLTGFFDEDSWAVCTLPRLASMMGTIGTLQRRKLAVLHENTQRWRHLPAFRSRVPWQDVRQHYARDESLYARVLAHGGCRWRSSSATIRRVLEAQLARTF